METMRFRLLDLMTGAGLTTAYALAKASKGRLPMTTAQRVVGQAKDGSLKRIDFETIDALCLALGCEPGELFEADTAKPKRRSR